MRPQHRTSIAIVVAVAALAAAPAAAEARDCRMLARHLHVAQIRVGNTSCGIAGRVLRQARRASRGWRPGTVMARGWRCMVSYRDGEFFPGFDLYVDCHFGRGWIRLSDAGSGW